MTGYPISVEQWHSIHWLSWERPLALHVLLSQVRCSDARGISFTSRPTRGLYSLSYPTRGFISHLPRTSAPCVLFRNDPHVDLDRALGILSNTSRQREVQPAPSQSRRDFDSTATVARFAQFANADASCSLLLGKTNAVGRHVCKLYLSYFHRDMSAN